MHYELTRQRDNIGITDRGVNGKEADTELQNNIFQISHPVIAVQKLYKAYAKHIQFSSNF
jgi:hypothetical protein